MIKKTIYKKLFNYIVTRKRWHFLLLLLIMVVTPFFTGELGLFGIRIIGLSLYYLIVFIINEDIYNELEYVNSKKYWLIKLQIVLGYLLILLASSEITNNILFLGINLDLMIECLNIAFLIFSFYFINPLVISKSLITYIFGKEVTFKDYYKDYFRTVVLAFFGIGFIISRLDMRKDKENEIKM